MQPDFNQPDEEATGGPTQGDPDDDARQGERTIARSPGKSPLSLLSRYAAFSPFILFFFFLALSRPVLTSGPRQHQAVAAAALRRDGGKRTYV